MILKDVNPGLLKVVLHSVQSYMESRRIPRAQNPTDNLMQENIYRQQLYSEIAEYMPTCAWIILGKVSKYTPYIDGMREALRNHIQNREFIDICLQYLNGLRDTDAPKQRAMVGALIIDLITEQLEIISKQTPAAEDDAKKKDKKDKKDELTEAESTFLTAVEPARIAAANLLTGLTESIKEVCPELGEMDRMFLAGCMLMGGSACIKNIYEHNMAVTADVFNIIINDTEAFESILAGALTLEEAAFQKNGANQKAFKDSLKRWVYQTLNMVNDPIKLHQFLVRAYGTIQPDVQTKLIKLNECGPTYGYLLNVVKQLIVDKK